MEDYVIRLIKKRDELNEDIAKGEKYISEHKFSASNEIREKMALLTQLILAMKAYTIALQLRIDMATKDKEFEVK